MEPILQDVRRGWNAPGGTLLATALAALPVSGLVALGVGVLTALPASLAVIVSGCVQFATNLWLAGRVARSGGRR